MNPEDIEKVANAVFEKMNAVNKGNDPKDPDAPKNTVEDEIKKKMQEESQSKSNEESLKNAIRFNLNVESFVEKNKAFLPSDMADIVKKALGSTFSNESERARQTQKLMLDAVFSKQEAVDLLPDTLKTKLSGYKALAEDEKLKRALDYYDLVETYSLLKKGQSAKEFNGGVDNKEKVYEDKFFGISKK